MTTTRAELDGSSFTSVSVTSASAPSMVVEAAETSARLAPIRPWLSLHGETLLLVVVDCAAVARLTLFEHGGRLDFLVAGLVLLFCAMSSLYRFRPQLSLLDDLPRLVTRVMAAVATVVTATALAQSEVDIRSVLVIGVQLLAVLVLTRIVTYSVIRHGRHVRCFAQPTLIVAEGRDGSRLVSMFRDHPEYGLVPIGVVTADPAGADRSGPVPVLHGLESLCAALEQRAVRQVVAQCGPGSEGELGEVIRSCALAHAELMFVPRQHELSVDATNGTHAWGQPLMPLRRGAFLSPFGHLRPAMAIALPG